MSNQIEPYHKPQHRELSLMNVVTDSWVEVLEDVAFLAGKIATTEFVPVSIPPNSMFASPGPSPPVLDAGD